NGELVEKAARMIRDQGREVATVEECRERLGLKKNDDGSLTAFVAVCTHLDCNVAYKPDQRKFFCACHDGWYDEKGVNIAGPPPSPLRTLIITSDEDNIIIKRTDT
ncbi:MAG: Rieske 2Fe-2S domain-containing protein, partial [Acidobacteria bacterium]|nr:Rieske 2Fe-2S domain-containing protein [Acidobacteriota bacterium]